MNRPERIDMSAFEGQFSEGRYSSDMPNDDFEQLYFLRDRIADVSGLLDYRKEVRVSIQEQHDKIQNLLRELEKIMAELRSIRDPLAAQLVQNSSDARADQRDLEALERQLARLLAEIAARQRFAAQRTLLDDNTKDKPWREKALPHQIEGAHRLVSAERGILGDKPGLGKTLQAIMTIDMLRAQGKGQKVLIFTPKSVLRDFERAFERWSPGKVIHVLNQSLKGFKGEILDLLAHFPECVVITNYEVWRKDKTIVQKLISCGFDTVIMDEAHVMKTKTSVTFTTMKEIVYAENKCPQCGGGVFSSRGFDRICANCEYAQKEFGDFCSVKNVVPMTGTPILNKPQELWPLLNLLDNKAFPKEELFLRDYCVKDYDYAREQYYWTFGSGGSDRLLKRLGMKYTARTRDSAGVVMPPQETLHHWLELDEEKYPKQYKFIKLLRDKARLAFADDVQMTTNEVLAWYTRMRQAASWPDSIQVMGCGHNPTCDPDELEGKICYAPSVIFPPPGSPKIGESILMDEAESVVREAVEEEERIVVFSMFRPVIEELERRCKAQGFRVAKIMGGVKDELRQEYIDDFNLEHTKLGEHKYDVLICQYQTAQVGLNLTGAHQLVCIEREWNPGKEEQTLDRLRRIDSQHESRVHLLHAPGTATDLIDALQEMKKNMIDGFQSDVDLQEAMRKFLEG